MAPGEPLQADEGQWALRKANYLSDEWAAQYEFAYAVQFLVETLQTGLQPMTIGPGNGGVAATFSVAQRPVRIETATLLLPGTNGTVVDVPIKVEDKDWWAENPVKNLTSPIVTHLYYSPDNPNGSLYFWPIPTIGYQVRLEVWALLPQYLAITDPVDGPGGSGIMPPAYRSAFMYTLAERLCPGLKIQPSPQLKEQAMKARTSLFGNNAEPPRITTDDGTPHDHAEPRYNFLTREPWK